MSILNENQYRCELCKEVFDFVRDETWSKDKAIEEAKSEFGYFNELDMEIVCDDCYEKIKPSNLARDYETK